MTRTWRHRARVQPTPRLLRLSGAKRLMAEFEEVQSEIEQAGSLGAPCGPARLRGLEFSEDNCSVGECPEVTVPQLAVAFRPIVAALPLLCRGNVLSQCALLSPVADCQNESAGERLRLGQRQRSPAQHGPRGSRRAAGQGRDRREKIPNRFPAHALFFLRVVRPRFKMYTGHVTAGGSVCIQAPAAFGP